MRTFLLFLLLLLPALASAQEEYFRRLAEDLCECLEQASAAPEQAAMPCLEQTALRNEEQLSKRFDLDVTSLSHRRLLAERLVPDLLDVCSLLSTLQLGGEEREISWSDGGRLKDASPQLAYTSLKAAPPPSGIAPGEPPRVWRISGELITRPGSNVLRLRTTDGKEMTFELPAATARKQDFQAGQLVSVLYRREWRLQQQEIVFVVVTIR